MLTSFLLHNTAGPRFQGGRRNMVFMLLAPCPALRWDWGPGVNTGGAVVTGVGVGSALGVAAACQRAWAWPTGYQPGWVWRWG